MCPEKRDGPTSGIPPIEPYDLMVRAPLAAMQSCRRDHIAQHAFSLARRN